MRHLTALSMLTANCFHLSPKVFNFQSPLGSFEPAGQTTLACTRVPGRFFTIWSPILWHSDGESKLQLCYEQLPQCSDGLILKPVPIWDCPPVNEVLPGTAVFPPVMGGATGCGERQDRQSLTQNHQHCGSDSRRHNRSAVPLSPLIAASGVLVSHCVAYHRHQSLVQPLSLPTLPTLPAASHPPSSSIGANLSWIWLVRSRKQLGVLFVWNSS